MDLHIRIVKTSQLAAVMEGQHDQGSEADGGNQSQHQEAVNQHEVGRRGDPRAAARQLPSRDYSYFRDSTGSSSAARVAGTVPKTTPTSMAAAKAMMTDR